jgi:hypothetical protein
LERAKDGDFDGEGGEFFTADGLVVEARVADDGLAGGGDGFAKGSAGVENSDAAAECVAFGSVDGDETAGGLLEDGVGDWREWEGVSAEAAGDDVCGEG